MIAPRQGNAATNLPNSPKMAESRPGVPSYGFRLVRIANPRSALARLPGPVVMVSSPAIGHCETEIREGTMRSVRTVAAAVLLLLPAYHVASAAEPKQGGILRVY